MPSLTRRQALGTAVALFAGAAVQGCSVGGSDSGSGTKTISFLTFETQNPQSVIAMIARARENARGAQETISAEAWSHVNRLYLYLSGPKAQRRFQADQFWCGSSSLSAQSCARSSSRKARQSATMGC